MGRDRRGLPAEPDDLSPLNVPGNQVSIRDMVAFTLMFPNLPEGVTLAAERIGITWRQADTLLAKLWPGDREDLLRQAANPNGLTDAHRLLAACRAALRSVCPTLEALNAPLRVRIAGGEATFLLVLPHVFARNPGLLSDVTIDLRRASGPAERFHAVLSGAADFAVGPAGTDRPPGTRVEPLFDAHAGLLVRGDDVPEGAGVTAHDFRDRPVFVIRPESAPEFTMRELVATAMARPDDPPGWSPRFCYVDSSMYVPALVRSTRGVGVYYTSPGWFVGDPPEGLVPIPLGGNPAARFSLITPVSREPTAAARAVIAAIRRTCQTAEAGPAPPPRHPTG